MERYKSLLDEYYSHEYTTLQAKLCVIALESGRIEESDRDSVAMLLAYELKIKEWAGLFQNEKIN